MQQAERDAKDLAKVSTDPPLVLLSCAPVDEVQRDRLVMHLTPLQDRGALVLWHRGLMAGGQVVQAGVEAALERAAVVVALLSAEYFADQQCQDELAQALRRAPSTQLLPVLLRSVASLDLSLLSDRQLLPRDRPPIARWAHQDDAWVEIVAELRALLDIPAAAPTRGESRPSRWHTALLAGAGGAGITALVILGIRWPDARTAPVSRSQDTHQASGNGWQPEVVKTPMPADPTPAAAPKRPPHSPRGKPEDRTPIPGSRLPGQREPRPQMGSGISTTSALPAQHEAADPRPAPTQLARSGPARCDKVACTLPGLQKEWLGRDTVICLRAPETPELAGGFARCGLDRQAADPLRCDRLDRDTADIVLKGAVKWLVPCPSR